VPVLDLLPHTLLHAYTEFA